ncbi:MAG: hypothetical protein QM571_02360 [Micrococcaceae bacterium]
MIQPSYGETPVSPENLVALNPKLIQILSRPPLKAEIYDLEQESQIVVAEKYVKEILEGKLTLDELLSPNFLCHLHRLIYEDIWQWAGKYRTCELNIGVAPELISMELAASFGNILYRWENTEDWNASPARSGNTCRRSKDSSFY